MRRDDLAADVEMVAMGVGDLRQEDAAGVGNRRRQLGIAGDLSCSSTRVRSCRGLSLSGLLLGGMAIVSGRSTNPSYRTGEPSGKRW